MAPGREKETDMSKIERCNVQWSGVEREGRK